MDLVLRKRIDRKGYALLGARLEKTIGSWEVFVEGANLLDAAYEDIPGVPQPGRWVGGGISFSLSNN